MFALSIDEVVLRQFVIASISRLSIHQYVISGFSFPAAGPSDNRSPPSQLAIFFLTSHRYYVPLRLPTLLLGFIRFRSLHPIPGIACCGFVFSSRDSYQVQQECL